MSKKVVKAFCKTCQNIFTSSSTTKVYCSDECREKNKDIKIVNLSKYLDRGKIRYAGYGEV